MTVVHFTPSPEPESTRLAPVTYLPGATPARDRVSFVAEPEDGGVDTADREFETADDTESGGQGRSDRISSRASDRATDRASNVALGNLARRGMSRWELEQVLAKREVDEASSATLLDRLEASGLIDDTRLAETLIFTLHTRKGLGRSSIERELRSKHIADGIIEEALLDIADEDELDRATELAVKRVSQLSSYGDETVKRRLNGFLARKGYNSSVIRQALDAAMSTRSSGVRFR